MAAESEPTLRDERSHAELGAERDRVAIEAFRGRSIGRLLPGRDLAEHAQGPRFVSALAPRAREPQGLLAVVSRLARSARAKMRLAQRAEQQRLIHEEVDRRGVVHGLLQHGDARRRAIGQRRRRGEHKRDQRREHDDVRVPAQLQRALPGIDALQRASGAQSHEADGQIRRDPAERVVDHVGDPDRFFDPGIGLGEVSQLGETPREREPAPHGRHAGHAEPRVRRLRAEQVDDLALVRDRPSVIAQTLVALAHEVRRPDPQRDIAQLFGDAERATAVVHGAIELPEEPAAVASRGRDLSQAAPIAERHGERLGGAHVLVHVHELAECPEAVAETDAEVQVPLEALRCLGQPLEDAQRLFEPLHRIAVGGARGRLDAGATQVVHGFLPEHSGERMMG